MNVSLLKFLSWQLTWFACSIKPWLVSLFFLALNFAGGFWHLVGAAPPLWEEWILWRRSSCANSPVLASLLQLLLCSLSFSFEIGSYANEALSVWKLPLLLMSEQLQNLLPWLMHCKAWWVALLWKAKKAKDHRFVAQLSGTMLCYSACGVISREPGGQKWLAGLMHLSGAG